MVCAGKHEASNSLILGGQDKGNDYNEIMELVKEKVKAIVALAWTTRRFMRLSTV